MIRQAISCDVCGTEKKQSNHWFVAYEKAGELRLGGWTSRNRVRPSVKHLCGQTCVHKLVDEFVAQTVAFKPLHTADDPNEDPVEYQNQPVAETQPAATAAPARSSHREPITTPASRPAQKPAARDCDQVIRDDDSNNLLFARFESWRAQNRNFDDSDYRALTTEYDFELDQECSARLIPTPEPVVARHRPPADAQPTPQRPALVTATTSTDSTITKLPLADQAPRFSSRKWRTEAWERVRAR